MRKALAFARSIKVAIVLLAYLAVSGMLATLVPQGRPAEFYRTAYPGVGAEILIRSGFTGFFSSILFLAPAGLFFVNLSACTIDRIVKEARKKKARRFGPVLLHLGLMLLAFGAVLSFSTRKVGTAYLSPGDEAALPGGRALVLLDFTAERYPDARPKDWTSHVRILEGGNIKVRSFPLRVNKPLKVGSLTLYQASYGLERILVLTDASGTNHSLRQGEVLSVGTENATFMAYEEESGDALIRLDRNAEPVIVRAGPGGQAGEFAIAEIRSVDTSGIQAVEDFGYPFVLAALLIIGAGAILTSIRALIKGNEP
jgi:cytochrome c biogenesis protein